MKRPQSITRSTIRITNLAVRTIIGFVEWERKKKQDIVINISLDFDSSGAVVSDSVDDTVDYKKLKRSIIELVEGSSFNLLEKLTYAVLCRTLQTPGVIASTVRIDKPHALRFADSVCVELTGTNQP